MRARLNIFRFNPETDKQPKYDVFEIDLEPHDTVLDALIKLYQEFDPSLSFRFACGNLKCGECGVAVNKVPCLACAKTVEPEMTVEPLPNLPVAKDLIIDRNRVVNNIFELASLLRTAPDCGRATGELDSKAFDDYVRLTSCLECLICQSSCPVLTKKLDQFVGPLGLLWLAQLRVLDNSRQAETFRFAEMCTGCGSCWKACPSKIDFLEDAITGLSAQP
jgi:succinate dehydrogenase/fumarate reductase iron-sulfur protein